LVLTIEAAPAIRTGNSTPAADTHLIFILYLGTLAQFFLSYIILFAYLLPGDPYIPSSEAGSFSRRYSPPEGNPLPLISRPFIPPFTVLFLRNGMDGKI